MKIVFPLVIAVVFLVQGCVQKKSGQETTKMPDKKGTINILTDDGAWCWFSDPRAIYYSENEIITGWVKKDGSIEIASLNTKTGESKFNTIFPQLETDDHDNPAFTILPDGNVFTMFAWHSTKNGVVYNTTSNKSDIESFGENIIVQPKTKDLLEQYPRESYTYANPYVLKEENNKLFAFGRWIGYKPNLIISEDNGESWSKHFVIISTDPFDPNNRPYVKYFSDGKSKIHMIFTDGHPNVEPLNSVYYCYYENGAFWKADGNKICNLEELPFKVEDASVVYQATETTGRAWIADIVANRDKTVILYSRHPEETDHRYHYAWYNSNSCTWEDYEICKAGKWFPQTQEGETERETYYMGNLTLQPSNTNIVYLSRQVNNCFEIEKFVTTDGGKNWEVTTLTKNSAYDQVRPYVPRYQSKNAKTVVLWMENKKYIHYTNYDTRIKYFMESE